jgi:hypothetical protein
VLPSVFFTLPSASSMMQPCSVQCGSPNVWPISCAAIVVIRHSSFAASAPFWSR